MEVTIRPVDASSAENWFAMRRDMGPEWLLDGFEALVREYLDTGCIQGLRHCVLMAFDPEGLAVGFVEVSLREYAEGCLTSPVGYLEGWCVAPHARRHGIGRVLVEAGERWAAAQGCTEFASDAELDNAVSLASHARLGFEPVADIRCFRKSIPGSAL
jgi:aminoglycoside 6'-N-acetyltransferase I